MFDIDTDEMDVDYVAGYVNLYIERFGLTGTSTLAASQTAGFSLTIGVSCVYNFNSIYILI